MVHTGESASRSPHRLLLAGRLDINRARALHGEARETLDRGGDVLIDWRDVEDLDTAALQVLLALRAALEAAGRRLRTTAAPAGVAHTLALAGLTGAFTEEASRP